MDESSLDLPPGFRFHPTDEELISHYLTPKILNHGAFATVAIGEADLNRCEPWDLPGKAKMGEKEWYFFCQRDRKYPTGMRTNRATESGYWKATGKDKEIFKGRGFLIGMKKTLVFYRGRAPKGEKSNWVMHEFRLEGKSSSSSLPKFTKDEWVVCRVFHKNNPSLKKSPVPAACSFVRPSGCFANELTGPNSLPPLMDTVPLFNSAGAFAASSPPPLLSDFYYSAHGAHAAYPTAMKRQQYCKAEGAQFSNQSMLSQDTGDRYTEISSVISKMDMASCASYGGAGVIDLHDLASMFR